MLKEVKKIAVTGAAGQIAYSLLFRIASGELLGNDQPVSLHLLDLPVALDALKGVKMELEDCAFPLLNEVTIGCDPYESFKGVNYAFLVGAQPRTADMERKDLLSTNAQIFSLQGRALNEVASKDVIVLVVGNPCNTNCLIALHNAPNLDRKRFFAMTMLDQNRAFSTIAKKAQVNVSDIKDLVIWGNHSNTLVPDAYNAKIGDRTVTDIILDDKWLNEDFIQEVQNRGKAVIQTRGKSSAASAANAALEAMRALVFPNAIGEIFSMAMIAEGNPYGIAEDIVFSFPCRSLGEGKVEIVSGFGWNPLLDEAIRKTEKELLEEKECIKDLLIS